MLFRMVLLPADDLRSSGRVSNRVCSGILRSYRVRLARVRVKVSFWLSVAS